MTPDCFLDTNILFYAAMARSSAPAKYERALFIMGNTHFAISGQVLAEFYVTTTRKTERPLTSAEALEWINRLRDRPFVEIDRDLVLSGIETAARYGINYYDGAILAAARRLGAPVVYSEDLAHGQSYGGVRVENPFRTH